MEFDPTLLWYHGSPLELETIRAGSTITQKSNLAQIFSHKPTIVSVSDDGQIKHNGNRPGYLYVISEDVRPEDITPHPETTMAAGDEWLTTRELQIEFVRAVEIVSEEQFTEMEFKMFLQKFERLINKEK